MSAERRQTRGHPQQDANLSSRRSNSRACIACHQRKIRCDILAKGSPCTNCESQGKSGCRIYENKKSRAAQARQARRILAIQPRNQQQNGTKLANATCINAAPAQDSQEDPVSLTVNASIEEQEEEAYQRNDRGSESATSGDREQLDEQASRNLAHLVDNEAVGVTEISSNHRLYFIGTEFSNLNYMVRQRSHLVHPDRLHFGSQHPVRKVSSVPAEALELPEKPLADELIRAYFTCVNPGWPIVDEEDFMERYKSTDPRRTVPLPLLHAVLLVGAHASATRYNDHKSLKSRFFRRAKMLIDARFEEDRRLYVQVALLLVWNCDNLEDIVSNSWYWIGFAARTALGLGMHRDSSKSLMSRINKREWIRLWWVLFQFDVLASVAYGRPQALRLDESDAEALRECHFEGIPNANIPFAIEHTRLCIIISESMRKVLALRATPAQRAEARNQADESLAQFITQLPESLRVPQPQADTWQSFLHLTFNNYLILLHRPPAPPDAPQQSLPDATNDLNICGDSAVVITSIFESIRARSAMSELALPSVYTLFTALVHVSSELNSPSPLVAAKSKRMLDSLLLSLQDLSHHWLYARSLLRLFEDRAVWINRRELQARQPIEPPTERRRLDGPREEDLEFSLRPNPVAISDFIPTQSPDDNMFTPTSMIPGQGSTYSSQVGAGMSINFAQGIESGDMLRGQPYHEGSDGGGLGMPADGFEMMPFPMALDFLLAGMGDEHP